ncbi:MAG: DNA topoisomerase VI subunit B [Candidatus Bathyarchaeia archaeon]
MTEVEYKQISPADFFYRNRDIAGFSNPTRAIYASVRELVENSLDACEAIRSTPEIYIRVTFEDGAATDTGPTKCIISVYDNGSGVPHEEVPRCFGRVLFGSKYLLQQTRGTFGLGGTMAILYAQITTNTPARVVSSVGGAWISEYALYIDIERNEPMVLEGYPKRHRNRSGWHGTIVEIRLSGDFYRAESKILEYLKRTAMVNPYATITLVDPKGRLYRFRRVTTRVPKPPFPTKPHPKGVDVEMLKRLVDLAVRDGCKSMVNFMTGYFQRIGKKTATRFLKSVDIPLDLDPSKLSARDVARMVDGFSTFDGFLSPKADCLSSLGKQLLSLGVRKELHPEATWTFSRRPSTYSGHPFIAEGGLAYGGGLPPGISLYRYANKIPLVYDEASDATWKVVNEVINWNSYRVKQDTPLAVITHICSTKIPYKTVGKEFIADRPEIMREVEKGIREVARSLRRHLHRKERIKRERERMGIFMKYLQKIARFSTDLAEREKEPDISPLLRKVMEG